MNNVNSEELGRVVASAIASYLQPNSQRQGRTEGNSTSTSTTSSATPGQVRTAQLYSIDRFHSRDRWPQWGGETIRNI
jgi:hypothetical protein